MRRSLGLVAATLVLLAGRAHGDVTKPVFDGVTMITRTTSAPSNVIHILEIDMTTPGVSLGSTTSSAREQRTSSFATAAGAAAAINGDLFSYATYATSGLAAGGHAKWADTSDDTSSANIAFSDGPRVEIHNAAETLTFDAAWMKGVVSGHPQLVKAGVKLATNPSSPACPTRNPRTAVGLSQDGKTVFMVVVDGRTTASVGMTCTELATLMLGLGAYQAINLDGGGSTTMYLKGTGVVNHPSDGTERIVGNHLAVYAPKLGTIGTVKGLVYEEPDHTHFLVGASVSLAGATVTTDDTGHYELDGVPGPAMVKALRPGYAASSVTVTITKGGTITADIGLTIDPTADFDGDGVPDASDVCTEVADPDQLDTDGDGLGDACDLDDDGDGIADEDDNCPLVANPDQADQDADGVGDVCTPDKGGGGCATTGGTPGLPVVLVGAVSMLGLRRRRGRLTSASRGFPLVGRRTFGLMLTSALAIHSGCSGRAQASPDGRFTLTPSLYEGSLIRLQVQERSTGTLIDDVKTRDTDAMKWVTGWADDTSYLFWGADTGTAWVRHIDGTRVTESPLQGAACGRLEHLFETKYDERRTNCLKP